MKLKNIFKPILPLKLQRILSIEPRINKKLFTKEDLVPTLSHDQMLLSQLCTQSQFNTDVYLHWCNEMKEKMRYHRKQWEFVYILQALNERGMLQKGKKGLGFGVGQEPLPAVMAKYGVQVLATDLGLDDATRTGWAQSSQHLSSLEILNKAGITSNENFKQLVSLREVDMNNIPSDLQDYDFNWLSCSFEHLGSIDLGLQFIENNLKTLKPGGIAVHTTEYNLSSDNHTIDSGGTVIFRKQDIKKLVKKLTAAGHEIYLNFNPGSQPLDKHIDIPPYTLDPHLRLQLFKYVSTSIGLIIRKKI